MKVAKDLSDREDLRTGQAICIISWRALESFWTKAAKRGIFENAIGGTIQIYFELVILYEVCDPKS